MKKIACILISWLLLTQAVFANPSLIITKALDPWSTFHQSLLNEAVERFNQNPEKFLENLKGHISNENWNYIKVKEERFVDDLKTTKIILNGNELTIASKDKTLAIQVRSFNQENLVLEYRKREMIIHPSISLEEFHKKLLNIREDRNIVQGFVDFFLPSAHAVADPWGLLVLGFVVLGLIIFLIVVVARNENGLSCKQMYSMTRQNLKGLQSNCEKAVAKNSNILQDEDFMKNLAALAEGEKFATESSDVSLSRALNGSYLNCDQIQEQYSKVSRLGKEKYCVSKRNLEKLCGNVAKAKKCLNEALKNVDEHELERKISDIAKINESERAQAAEKLKSKEKKIKNFLRGASAH